MKYSAKCSRPRLAALALVTSFLSACATISSERITGVRPPVVEYSRTVQAKVAQEVQNLPEGSAVVEILGDYAFIWEQVRECLFPQTAWIERRYSAQSTTGSCEPGKPEGTNSISPQASSSI